MGACLPFAYRVRGLLVNVNSLDADCLHALQEKRCRETPANDFALNRAFRFVDLNIFFQQVDQVLVLHALPTEHPLQLAPRSLLGYTERVPVGVFLRYLFGRLRGLLAHLFLGCLLGLLRAGQVGPFFGCLLGLLLNLPVGFRPGFRAGVNFAFNHLSILAGLAGNNTYVLASLGIPLLLSISRCFTY